MNILPLEIDGKLLQIVDFHGEIALFVTLILFCTVEL